MTPQSRSSRWLPLAVLAVTVAALWVWAPILLERVAPELSRIADSQASDGRFAGAAAGGATPPVSQAEDCDLSTQACTLTAAPPWGSGDPLAIRLEITPQPIPMLESLSITVQPEFSGPEDAWPDAFEIDFAGVDMFMGYQRTTLQRDGAVWRGNLRLPLCTTQRMQWAATLLPSGDPEGAFAQYRFWTERRAAAAGRAAVSDAFAVSQNHDPTDVTTGRPR